MAIYHFSVQIIGRQAGRSAVAAAAYRSGEKITNQYDGIVHDYTKKQWITHTDILLPAHAPQEFKDRQTLWNSVEEIEKSSNAQLAREITVAIPTELPSVAQIELIQDFVKNTFVSEGMCTDIAIHNPPVMDDLHRPIDSNGHPTSDISKMTIQNPHAHVLLTMRPLDSKGRWQKKSVIQYICKKGSEEKAFTADEFKSAKLEGWQKQYRYYDDHRRKVWLTSSEAAAHGYKRINRTPKTTPMGMQNPIIARWNSKECITEWRKAWADWANKYLDKYDIPERIDHRSFVDQGRELEVPTLHMGPSATNIEKRAERRKKEGAPAEYISLSDIGDINRLIKRHNKVVKMLLSEDEKVQKNIENDKNLYETHKEKLSSLRSKLIGLEYERLSLEDKNKQLSVYINQEQDRINRYEQEHAHILQEISSANKHLAGLNQELAALSRFDKKKKDSLIDKITKEEAINRYLQEHAGNLLTKYRFSSLRDVSQAKENLIKMEQDEKKLGKVIMKTTSSIRELSDQYMQVLTDIPSEEKEEIIEGITEEEIDPEMVMECVRDEGFSDTVFYAATNSVDQALRISRNAYKEARKQIKKERRKQN